MFMLNDPVSSDSSADSDDSGGDDGVDQATSSHLFESSTHSLHSQTDDLQTQRRVAMNDTARIKRTILWCDVDNDFEESHNVPVPSTLSPPSAGLRLDKQERRKPTVDPYTGVPLSAYTKGDKMQLYCQSKQFLAIYPDGKVRGTMDKSDPHTRLEMIPTGYPGHVVIRGLLSNLYIAMNSQGRLRAQGNRDAEMSVFVEGTIGAYFTYLSRHHAYLGWYLGIKRTGKFKNGKKTKLNQKAVRFLKLKLF